MPPSENELCYPLCTPCLKQCDHCNKPIVWVLGGPGSGKSTQCQKIIQKYELVYLSTGEILRTEVKSGSDRAEELKAIMDDGQLIPNEIMLELLTEAMAEHAAEGNGFLIDGYPREICQGVELEDIFGPVTAIIYFEASFETLMKRLLERSQHTDRTDNTEETIKHRLRTFLDNNQLVLDQYPDKIYRIDAEQEEDEIFAEVQKVLDPIMENSGGVTEITD